MLVWRLNLAWKSGHSNQCLRLGDDAKTNRALRACFRESASYSSPLSARARTMLSLCTLSPTPASTDLQSVAPHASTSAFPKLESATRLNARDASVFRLFPNKLFCSPQGRLLLLSESLSRLGGCTVLVLVPGDVPVRSALKTL